MSGGRCECGRPLSNGSELCAECNHSVYTPTQEEISDACHEIQMEWSDYMRDARRDRADGRLAALGAILRERMLKEEGMREPSRESE